MLLDTSYRSTTEFGDRKQKHNEPPNPNKPPQRGPVVSCEPKQLSEVSQLTLALALGPCAHRPDLGVCN